MNKKIESIKNLVLQEKEYFTDRGGVDITIVRRRFRQVEGFSMSREDVTDALIEMKKDGLLRYNLGALNMEFTND